MDRDTYLIFESYQLNGKAKDETLEDLAQKHKVEIEQLKAQLEKGIKTEHEHTKDEQTARKIAMDHLAEDPKYYDKLSKIEKEEDAEMPYPEFAKLSKHSISKLPDTQELSYTHERIAAMLPQDIGPGKDGENEILDKAASILAKLIFNGDVKKAARMMFYDEDFNSDLVSVYRHFQEVGFPETKEKEESEFKEQMPDSREEYSAQEYAKEMEVKGEAEERPGDVKRRKDNESRWMSILKNYFGKEYRREGVDPYVEFFERYSPFYEDWVIKKFSDMYNQTWASDPESRIDVEHFIKIKNELRDRKDMENEKLRSSSEEEERRLDPKCWKGYHKAGTKLKNGVRVNNCVKNK